MSHVPLRFMHALGARLGWLVFWASPTYRRHLRVHVAQAGLPQACVDGAARHAGRMVAELPWLWGRGSQVPLGGRIQWENTPLLDAALARGRGVLLLSPHVGAFEVIAQSYAERFGSQRPMTALYRPARKAWLRELVAQSRNRPGLNTVPAQLSGVRQMIRALRRGEAVGLLPDQVPPDGQGVWVPFFGKPAYTMTLVGRLARQTKAEVLLLWCERLPQGRGYVVRVQAPPQPWPDSDDAPQWALAVNEAMEFVIRQCSDQYLWGYNRYKQPRTQPQDLRQDVSAGDAP